jgi:hypothetical protein
MRRIVRVLLTVTAASTAVLATGSPAPALVACDATFRIVTTPNAAAGDTQLESADAWSLRNVWAVGNGNDRPFSTHWNGSDWIRVTVPVVGQFSQLFEVAVAGAHDVWALGTFTDSHDRQRSLAMHRTTGGWVHVATPNIGTGSNSLYRLAVVGPHDVWAGGRADVGGVTRPLVAHWNGTTWSRVAFPTIGDGNNFLEGLAAAGPGDVWVAVQFANASAVFRGATYHREGTSWHRVPFTQPGSQDVDPRDLLALGSDSVWMTGFYSDTGATIPLVEHWNGSTWVQFNAPAPSSFVFPEGLAALGPHAVFAFGSYDEGSTTHALVERYNGAGWHQVTTTDVGGATLSVFNGGAAAGSGTDGRVWGAGFSEASGVRQSLVEQSCP